MGSPRKFPDLYYSDSSNEDNINKSEYSYAPPGMLNASRLANGQPYWSKPSVDAPPLKKKTILLVNLYEAQWPEEKKEKANQFLRELIDDGFQLFVLYRQLNDTLEKFKIDKHLSIVTARVDYKTLREEYTSFDTCIMDHYLLDILIDPKLYSRFQKGEVIPRALDIQYHHHLVREAFDILSQATPPLSVCKLGALGGTAQQGDLKKLKESFPSIHFIPQYHTWLVEEDFYNPSLDEVKNVKTLILSGYPRVFLLEDSCAFITDERRCIARIPYGIWSDNSLNIEELEIQYATSYVDKIHQLLCQKSPHLKELVLRDCSFIPKEMQDDFNYDNDISFDQLTHISILSCGENVTSIRFLQWLLSVSPNLICFSIGGFGFDADSKRRREQILENLEKIIQDQDAMKKMMHVISYNSFYFHDIQDTTLAGNTFKVADMVERRCNEGQVFNAAYLKLREEVKNIFAGKLPFAENSLASDSTQTQSRAFDPTEMLNKKPSDFTFHDRGEAGKDQKMLMKKLTQYYTSTGQHVEAIPKIKLGICYAAAKLFADLELDAWNKMIKTLVAWDGSEEELSNNPVLKKELEQLSSYFMDIYLHKKAASRKYYAGNELLSFLESSRHLPFIMLLNPWHAITIKPEPSSDKG